MDCEMKMVHDCEDELVVITPESRVYVIGGISKYGKENDWNRASFEYVRDVVKAQFGAYATIPHDFIPEDDPYEDQMQASFEFLKTADVVVRLGDWQESSGATRESELCISLGIPLVDEDALGWVVYN